MSDYDECPECRHPGNSAHRMTKTHWHFRCRMCKHRWARKIQGGPR